MTRLFTLAIFFSATLLFMVQPLAGKILLPVLGGSPSVWSTCMVFFQGVLLLGYLYAHVLSTRVALRWQRIVHLSILVAASVSLPIPIDIGEPSGSDPRLWLIRALVRTVGLPFFALSSTAPLLLRWFSRTDEPASRDPYFLYAASNAGSLLGLVGYLLLEPFAARSAQALGWSVGFWSVGALVAACAVVDGVGRVGGVGSVGNRVRAGTGTGARTGTGTGTRNHLLWIGLSLVPSALLLGVTQHLATDVVSVPLLWVAPLALYLTTFIAAFSTKTSTSAWRWGVVSAWFALAVLALSLADIRYPILPIALTHLAAFMVLAMLCHTRLAEARPDPAHLTDYFLCISIGGVLGGAAVALVAPLVFTSILEYPLAIGAAILLRPQTMRADRMPESRAVRWAWRAAAAMLAVAAYWGVSVLNDSPGVDPAQQLSRALLVVPAAALMLSARTALLFAGAVTGFLIGAAVVRTGGDALHRERTFFGVHEVTSQQNGDWHVLTHGTTTHGIQAFRGKARQLPTAYYHPSGPIGDVIFQLSAEKRFKDVAVVGLGAGALAAYAGNGVRMDFFEVDAAVIRIAEDQRYFTYLADARARSGVTIRTSAVDGRSGLRAAPENTYDLIVIDAFSSDAIPTHLITREAIALYASRLKARGVIAFHVSNRFFNLGPVLGRIAADQALVSFVRNDNLIAREREVEGMRPSVWIVLARDENDLGQIPRSAPRWVPVASSEALWTDDYTNVLGALQD